MVKQQARWAIALLLVAFTPLAAHGQEPKNKVKIHSAAAIGSPVAARRDHQGIIHLLCDGASGPSYARSTDQGESLCAPIPVVARDSQASGLEYHAWDLAVGKDGRVHLALGSNAWKLKLPQEDWGYYYTYKDENQATFLPVRNINRKPSEGFSIAADEAGTVTACWLSDKLFVTVSNDNGATFGPSRELNAQYNPCNCCTTSAIYTEDGRLAVLYREETRNERDMHVVLWDQLRDTMTRTRVSQTLWKIEACPMSYYTLSAGKAGLLAVWPTRGEIFFTRLDGQARSQGRDEIKTPGRAGMRTGMVALESPDGTTLVAWKNAEKLGWQLYDQTGSPLGEPGSVESPGAGVAGAVRSDGGFVLFR